MKTEYIPVIDRERSISEGATYSYVHVLHHYGKIQKMYQRIDLVPRQKTRFRRFEIKERKAFARNQKLETLKSCLSAR